MSEITFNRRISLDYTLLFLREYTLYIQGNILISWQIHWCLRQFILYYSLSFPHSLFFSLIPSLPLFFSLILPSSPPFTCYPPLLLSIFSISLKFLIWKLLLELDELKLNQFQLFLPTSRFAILIFFFVYDSKTCKLPQFFETLKSLRICETKSVLFLTRSSVHFRQSFDICIISIRSVNFGPY